MIQKFIPLDVDQQVTEMDVSIYTSSSESFPTSPRERLIRQAYKYRDLFDVYKRYSSELTSVTVWGLADDDTWLDTFPVVRDDAPPPTTTPPPSGACQVTYRIAGQWPGGFQGEVRIAPGRAGRSAGPSRATSRSTSSGPVATPRTARP